MKHMVTREELVVDPRLRLDHDNGVNYSVQNKTELAREIFGNLLDSLEGDDSPMATLLRARVNRDFGFTYTRDAIAANEPNTAETALAIIGESKLEIDKMKWASTLTPDASSYVHAELGASMTLLARTLTVQGLLLLARYSDQQSNPPDQIVERVTHPAILRVDQRARAEYREAFEPLRRGDNVYYRTSNAINAFRHYVAFCRELDLHDEIEEAGKEARLHLPAFVWLARSAGYAAMAGLVDRDNAVASARTLVGRLDVVRGVEAARKSVLERP